MIRCKSSYLKKHNNLRVLAIFVTGLFVFASDGAGLAPFLGGRVDLHLEAGVTYDSNIFTNFNEESDLYFTLRPEFQYERSAGVLNMDVRTGVGMVRFVEFTGQDSEDFFGALTLTYPNRPDHNPRRIIFDIGWRQESDVNEDVGARTHADVFETGVTFRDDFSARFAYRVMGTYQNYQYRRPRLSEVDIGTVGADAIHLYSDHLETFIGYRYRNSQTGGRTERALNIEDHLLHGGLEGQLSSKVTGLISVGIQNRTFDNELDDSLRPYGHVSLAWTPRHRSVVTFAAENDMDVAANDRSVDRTSIRLILDQQIYMGLSMQSSISYANVRLRRADGSTRGDDRMGAGLAFTYELAGGATLALDLSYLNRQSDEEFFEYERYLADISGSIRF